MNLDQSMRYIVSNKNELSGWNVISIKIIESHIQQTSCPPPPAVCDQFKNLNRTARILMCRYRIGRDPIPARGSKAMHIIS